MFGTTRILTLTMCRYSSSVVLFVGVVLLSLMRTGSCAVTAEEVIPESGSVIYDVVGSSNVHIFCDVRNNGSAVLVNWFKQSPEDREEDRSPDAIVNDDTFTLSGDIAEDLTLNTNLTISSLTEDLNDVIIFCGLDDFAANFTLRIYFPPMLSDRGKITRRENEQLSLDMSDSDSHPAFPFPSDVTWRQDRVELVNISDTRVFGYPSIFIGSVLQSDAGPYTLTATNYQLDGVTLVGTDSGSFTLNVLFGAGLVAADPESVAVLEGDSVTLECGTDLTGNPIPTVVWRDSSDSEVSPGGRFTLSSGREVVSITVDSTNREDAGNWTCTAQVYENGTGSLTVGGPVEVSVQLVVIVAPSAPENVTVEQVGSTWISLSWFQSTRGIPPLSRRVIVVMGGGEDRNVSEESSEMAANVTGLLPGTEYMFRVVVVSEFKGVQAFSPPSYTLTTRTAVSAPGLVCLEQPTVDDTELVISWSYSYTGGLNITDIVVEYRNESSESFTHLQFFTGGSGSSASGEMAMENSSVSLPLPEVGVNYFFRVTASNEEGSTTVACPGILLTTGIPAIPNAPELINQSNSEVYLNLSTDFSGVFDPVADNFTFILHMRRVDVVEVVLVIPVLCPKGGRACSMISHLLLRTHPYEVSLSAENRYGTSESSAALNISGTTEEDPRGGVDAKPLLIGASIGGGILLIVSVILLMVALWMVRRKSTDNNSPGNDAADTPGLAMSKKQVSPVQSQVTSCDPLKKLYEMPELHDLDTGRNTFCSPGNTDVHVNMAVYDDGNYEVKDGPVMDDGLYDIAGGPISDNILYANVAVDVSLNDVPRPSSPHFDTFDNSAYNAVTFDEIPTYANINKI